MQDIFEERILLLSLDHNRVDKEDTQGLQVNLSVLFEIQSSKKEGNVKPERPYI